VSEKPREAGPGQTPGPAREQVVIKDNRKIDPAGRPRNQAAGDAVPAADKPAGDAKPSTPGQPGRAPEATKTEQARPEQGEPEQARPEQARSGAKSADIVDAEEIVVDAEEIVAGEVVSDGPVKVAAPTGLGAELESLRSELDERLRDLQRVTAEYANYRKRVDRDRAVVVEQAIGMVVTALLPILDDLDRAREHDDLVGPSAAMAEQLSAALAKFGLTAFGEPGDAFDPTRHEAVAHQTSADVTEPTCVAVMRRGYLLGERLLRAALVAVADPE
jgi:molecular chaperone GrpE